MTDETKDIESYLRSLPIVGGFKVPAGYFENLEERLALNCSEVPDLSLGDEKLYEVPEAYFEQLNDRIMQRLVKAEAKKIPLHRQPVFMWVSGIAASFLLVAGLYLYQPAAPGTAVNMVQPNTPAALEVSEVAEQFSATELDVDMLCDAGWCNELEELSKTDADKNTDRILLETDEDLIIDEL